MYLYETRHHFLINKCKSIGLKHLNGRKVLFEESNDIDDFYENIDQ